MIDINKLVLLLPTTDFYLYRITATIIIVKIKPADGESPQNPDAQAIRVVFPDSTSRSLPWSA